MNIKHKAFKGAQIFSLKGEVISELGIAHLKRAIQKHVTSKTKHLVIDLSKVKYIDCIALGWLVRTKKIMAKYRTHLSIAGVNNNIQEILKITKLENFFSQYNTLMDARRMLKKL